MDPIDRINEFLVRMHPSDEVLLAFVGGQLSSEQTEDVVEHLSNCEDCRELAMALGWLPHAEQSAEIHQLPIKAHANDDGPGLSAIPVSVAFTQELAALQELNESGLEEAFIQLVPGASNGAAALGYVRNLGVDLAVVVGAGDEAVKVQLGTKEYEVSLGAANEPRIVKGLNRKNITIWLSAGGKGGFKVLRQ